MKILLMVILCIFAWYLIISLQNKLINSALIKHFSESTINETRQSINIIFFFTLFLSIFSRFIAIVAIPITIYMFRDKLKIIKSCWKQFQPSDKAKLIIVAIIYLVLILL